MSTTQAFDAGITRIYEIKDSEEFATAPTKERQRWNPPALVEELQSWNPPALPEGPHSWGPLTSETAVPSPHRKTLPLGRAALESAPSQAPTDESEPSRVPTLPPLAVASMLTLTFAGLVASLGMAVEAML